MTRLYCQTSNLTHGLLQDVSVKAADDEVIEYQTGTLAESIEDNVEKFS